MSFMRPLTIIMLSLLRSQCASGFAARRASRFRADAYVSDEPVRHLHVTKRFSWRLLHKPASATALGRVWALCRWVGQRHKADNAPSISPLRMAALLCNPSFALEVVHRQLGVVYGSSSGRAAGRSCFGARLLTLPRTIPPRFADRSIAGVAPCCHRKQIVSQSRQRITRFGCPLTQVMRRRAVNQ